MDQAATLRALVAASQLPLSLLIVGVGWEDFSAMEVLDGDIQRIRSPEGQVAARDTVQFVPLRPNQRLTVESLAAQLLAELPGQVRAGSRGAALAGVGGEHGVGGSSAAALVPAAALTHSDPL